MSETTENTRPTLRQMMTRDGNISLPPILPHANQEPVTIEIPGAPKYSEYDLLEIFSAVRMRLSGDNEAYVAWSRDGRGAMRGLVNVEQTRLSKRVASMLKKDFGIKIEKETQEFIGNIDQKYRNVKMTLDVTDVLDWDAGDFSDDRSCYWNSRHYLNARLVALPSVGAYALRSYDNNGKGNGRCWIIPLPWTYQNRSKSAPPMYVATNHYGAMATVNRTSAPVGVRAIVAWLQHFTGEKWVFSRMNEYKHAGAYINGDSWLIHPETGCVKTPAGVRLSKNHFVLPEPDWVKKVKDRGVCPICERSSSKVTDEPNPYSNNPRGKVCLKCLETSMCKPLDKDGSAWELKRDCVEIEAGKWFTLDHYKRNYRLCDVTGRHFPISDVVEVICANGAVRTLCKEKAATMSTMFYGKRYLIKTENRYYMPAWVIDYKSDFDGVRQYPNGVLAVGNTMQIAFRAN